jgi:phage baseplate assembly protein W
MSREFEVAADNAPVVIGATGMEDIVQCLRVIARTVHYSVPLDRGFAATGAYIDSPLPQATAARIAALTEAIERYEPRVRVTSIRFLPDADGAMDGRMVFVVRFHLREGVSL